MNVKRFTIILLIGLIISIGLIAFSVFSKISHVGIKNRDQSSILIGDSNGEYWYRTWGGTSSDYGEDIALDSSDNIYITGYTRSYGAGESDMCLVKYNSGDLEWYRTWGGSGNERGQGLALDSSGNIYITGYTESFGAGQTDIILVKYNSSGDFEWHSTWGGSNEEFGCDIAIDSSGDIYVVGNSREDDFDEICLIKYNSLGVQQWNRTWDSTEDDWASEIAIDSSDNIYIIGGTFGFGADGRDMCLIKYNKSGDLEWNHIWGGISSGIAIVIDSSDSIYIAGMAFEDVRVIVLAKYDQSIRQWSRKLYSNSKRNFNYRIALALDSLENIYLAGDMSASYGNTYNDQMYLAKYNYSGTLDWELQWGASGWETCNAIGLDSSDNIYLVGSTNSYGAGSIDLCLIKNPIDTTVPSTEPINPLIFLLSFVGSYILFTIGMLFLSRKRPQISGIILTVVGMFTIVLDFMFFYFPIGTVVGIVLFSIGLRFLIYSSKRIPSRKARKELPVELQVEVYAKRYSLKKKSGISLTAVGIALILIGTILWITVPHHYAWGQIIGAIALCVIGGILFIPGVGLWIQSASIKERMKKLENEKIRKTKKREEEKRLAAEKSEKEEKDDLELEGIVQ